MNTYKPSLGSISHGTLRTQDLLEAFVNELDRFTKGPDAVLPIAYWNLIGEARAVLLLDGAGWSDLVESDLASDLVNSLQDALSDLAPPYCYFGTYDGDGSDFGFWPSMEQIDELPRVADPADVPEGGTGEDCAFVNDYGSVTVYGADGSVLLELV